MRLAPPHTFVVVAPSASSSGPVAFSGPPPPWSRGSLSRWPPLANSRWTNASCRPSWPRSKRSTPAPRFSANLLARRSGTVRSEGALHGWSFDTFVCRSLLRDFAGQHREPARHGGRHEVPVRRRDPSCRDCPISAPARASPDGASAFGGNSSVTSSMRREALTRASASETSRSREAK